MVETSSTSPSESTFSSRFPHLAIVAVLSGFLLFTNLHEGGLSGYDDALYAHEGEQILLSGDWWNIRCNGGFNFEYPPMFFWLEAISMSIWGITDFAAKFPSAVAGLLTIIAIALIGRSFARNDLYPICAAWILMLTQYFLKYSMHAMTDVPYTLFFTLAILFYSKGLKRPWYFPLFGLAIASAVLTRSALGFLPMALIICHTLLTQRLRLFRSPQYVFGILLSLVLPAFWYVSQYFIHGHLFIDQSLSVVTSKISFEGNTDTHSLLSDLLRYPGMLLKLYWPWLPFMIIGFLMETKKALRQKNSSSILLILWVVCIIGPMSFAESKALRYIMPVFPAFALLAAAPVSDWIIRVRRKPYIRAAFFLLCILITGIGVFSSPNPRALEICSISSAVESHIPLETRYFLYTNGEYRNDCRNQFLWYSKRYLDYLADPSELIQKLEDDSIDYVVIDRSSFEDIIESSGAKITILSETDTWVFFKTNRQAIS